MAYGKQIYSHMINSSPEYYDIICAAQTLGKEVCDALPFLYAFTGCDIVSSFFSKGKCKAWDAWQQSKQKNELTAFCCARTQIIKCNHNPN